VSRYFRKQDLEELAPLFRHRKHRVWDHIFNTLVDLLDLGFEGVEFDIDALQNAKVYDCDASVQVAQAVYIDSEDHVAPAVAGAGGKPAKGVVLYKPSTTQAVIMSDGPVDGFTGLVPEEEYFLSMVTPGAVVTPAQPAGPPGSFVQYIGTAATETVMQVDPEDSPIYFD